MPPSRLKPVPNQWQGKVRALTGTDKSDAGRAATAKKRDEDLARDSVAVLHDAAALLDFDRFAQKSYKAHNIGVAWCWIVVCRALEAAVLHV